MKMILTLKTEKKKPSKKELDKIIEIILRAGALIDERLKFHEIKCHCMKNGCSLTLIK